MIAGFAARVTLAGLVNGFTLEGIGSPTETLYYFTLGGPCISALVMVAVSLLTQRQDAPIELELDPIEKTPVNLHSASGEKVSGGGCEQPVS